MKKVIFAFVFTVLLFGFHFIESSSYSVVGKVLKAYKAPGYGRMASEWLFMDVKDKKGNIVKIAIAPTFRIPNLGVNEGNEVKILGFTPPMFPNGVIKATDIYDVTKKRDYPVWGGG